MSTQSVNRIYTVLQMVAALVFLFLFSSALVTAESISRSVFADALTLFMPNIMMILGAVAANVILSLKHQGQTPERFLLPLFLLCVTIESIYLLPEVTEYLGYPVISGTLIVRLSRTALVYTAVTLFFASVMSIRSSSMPKAGATMTFAFLACLSISFFVPAASELRPYDIHNSMLALLSLTITLAAIITYFLQFLKEKEHYNLIRFLTMLFLGSGEFIIMLTDNIPPLSITGAIIFTIGIVLLVTSAQQSY